MNRAGALFLIISLVALHSGEKCIAQIYETPGNFFTAQSPFASNLALFANYRTEAEDSSITIYPNPASDQLVVTVPDHTLCQEISVYNCIGVAVLRMENVNSHRATVYLAHIPDGQYVLRVKTDRGMLYRKFIINR
jgi:hypothetical protein